MQIKYVGPKPIISKTGISFDSMSDDRYTYLNIVVQLLNALDHDYFDNKVYSYATDSKRLNDDEVLQGLQRHCGDLSEDIQKAQDKESQEISKDITRAKENQNISEEEREAFIKNIEMMRSYRLQYVQNEALYNAGVNELANLVKKDHIDYVIVPMFQRFAAVLHSVQQKLLEQKLPVRTKMSIFEENGQLLAKMDVINTSSISYV